MPQLQSRTVSLFKNGKNQALRIPKEFEFDAEEAVITRSKNGTLKVVPLEKKQTLAELFDKWAKEDNDPAEFDFPEIEDLPLKDIDPFKDFDESED